MSWVLYTLVFGICKGVREGIKKKALEKNGIFEVLFLYTLIGFLLVLPTAHNVFDIPGAFYFYIFIKSALVFTAWICSFNSIKHMPVSLYGVMDMARVIFATVLGIVIMGESASMGQMTGLVMVVAGLILVNVHKKGEAAETDRRFVLLTLLSCLLTATSGVMDKWLTKTVTSSQLQFWYMLFMTLMYGVYIIISRTPVNIKTVKTNYWIPILSIIFVIGDRALFMANENPDSRIVIMTLVKQSSVLAAIAAGRIMFCERGTVKRTLCALLIIAGIMVATLA
ncbi:MAG: EamA family transporter [Clostridia bacterium]|nr:EamA family transporter [Clostridia bacterium]